MKTNRFLLFVALLWIGFPGVVWPGVQATFYVSANGSDANAGSLSKPFKTLEKARNEIRKINLSMSGDILVYLLPGTHPLSAPFTLTSQDSGSNGFNVIYQAYTEKSAVISGGIQISPENWSLYDEAKNIYRAYVGALETRQLYVNGQRATRARNRLYEYVFTQTDYGYETTNLDMQSWDNKQDVEIVCLTWWKSFRGGVESITGNQIRMKEPFWSNGRLHYNVRMRYPSWVENAYELLDEEGEWYLNRATGYLYYKPRSGDDMLTATVMVPQIQTLVSGTGTLDKPLRNVIFRGLVFAYSTWTAPNGNEGFCPLQADYHITGSNNTFIPKDLAKIPAHFQLTAAQSIRLERNVFTHLGGSGVSLEYGSQNNVIDANIFQDISGTAIRVGHIDDSHKIAWDPRMIVKDNYIRSNYITEAGVDYLGSVGILVTYAAHTEITHNELYKLPYTGISVGWGWTDLPTTLRDHKIFFNRIHDVMRSLGDGAGIYLLSRQDGTEIVENYIYDVRQGRDTGWVWGNAGIMLDNGCAYIRVEHNVLENIAGRPVHLQTDSGLTGHDNWTINNETQDVGVKYQSGTQPIMWKWASQYTPPYHIVADGVGDMGARFADVNGDGLPDMVYHRWFSGNVMKGAYLNTGSGWRWAPEFAPPFHIAADGYGDLGARFIDLNGDGKSDLVYHRDLQAGDQQGALTSNGSGWQWSPEFIPPYPTVVNGIGETGVRFIDVNGDGRIDMVYSRYARGTVEAGAYLNNGHGWVGAPEFTPPYPIVSDDLGDLGVRFLDLNGDGLVDMVYRRLAGKETQKGAYLNTGHGWQSAPEYAPLYPIVADGLGESGVRFIDLNGDGRIDMVYHRLPASGEAQKGAYLNTGSGWKWAPEHIPPSPIWAEGIGDLGVRFIDVNGDKIVDMVYYRYSDGKLIRGAYLNVPTLVPHTGTAWQWSPEYTPPYHIVADGNSDLGARFVDLNGDGLLDLVYHRWFNGNVMKGAYLNAKP